MSSYIRPGDEAIVNVQDRDFKVKAQSLRWQRDLMGFLSEIRKPDVEQDLERYSTLVDYLETVLVNPDDQDLLDAEMAIALLMSVALKAFADPGEKKN